MITGSTILLVHVTDATISVQYNVQNVQLPVCPTEMQLFIHIR